MAPLPISLSSWRATNPVRLRCSWLISPRANAYYGAWALAVDAAELPLAAAATEAFHLASKENIQTHGGNGFTRDVDCHLYYRRSKQLALVLGGAPWWKNRLVELLEMRNAA